MDRIRAKSQLHDRAYHLQREAENECEFRDDSQYEVSRQVAFA